VAVERAQRALHGLRREILGDTRVAGRVQQEPVHVVEVTAGDLRELHASLYAARVTFVTPPGGAPAGRQAYPIVRAPIHLSALRATSRDPRGSRASPVSGVRPRIEGNRGLTPDMRRSRSRTGFPRRAAVGSAHMRAPRVRVVLAAVAVAAVLVGGTIVLQ